MLSQEELAHLTSVWNELLREIVLGDDPMPRPVLPLLLGMPRVGSNLRLLTTKEDTVGRAIYHGRAPRSHVRKAWRQLPIDSL